MISNKIDLNQSIRGKETMFKILDKYNVIPPASQSFLIKIIFVFILWKLFYFLIQYYEIPLDKTLTYNCAGVSKSVLNYFFPSQKFELSGYQKMGQNPYGNNENKCEISLKGRIIVNIADGCNALEVYILYLSFLVSFSKSFKRILVFIVLGFTCIYTTNILRIVILSLLHLFNSGYQEFAHHYVFKMALYLLVVLLWLVFVKWDQKT